MRENNAVQDIFTGLEPSFFRHGGPQWPFLKTWRYALERRRKFIRILQTAKRPRKYPLTVAEWEEQRRVYQRVAGRLQNCVRTSRCGSLACPICRRAWAKTQFVGLRRLADRWSGQEDDLKFLTLVPTWRVKEAQLGRFRAQDAQEWFHHSVAPVLFDVTFFGVLEISYEEVINGNAFFQPHWHLLAMAPSKVDLRARLQPVFPPHSTRNPGAHAKPVYDLKGLLAYMSKVDEKGFRWSGGSGQNAVRRVIPVTRQREILCWLDGTSPIDLVISSDVAIPSP